LPFVPGSVGSNRPQTPKKVIKARRQSENALDETATLRAAAAAQRPDGRAKKGGFSTESIIET
jgi:hypothetical protein